MGPEEQSLLELFARETEAQMATVVQRLLELEQSPQSLLLVDELMRAMHSLKGAARVVGLDPIVWVAHAMEDCLGLVRAGRLSLGSVEIDMLLRAADGIHAMAREAPRDLAGWLETHQAGLREILDGLAHWAVSANGTEMPASAGRSVSNVSGGLLAETVGGASAEESAPADIAAAHSVAGLGSDPAAWSRRWDADRLNRLMSLAGQALSDVRRLAPLVERVEALRRQHAEAGRLLEGLRRAMAEAGGAGTGREALAALERQWAGCTEALDAWYEEIRGYDRRTVQWSRQLYLEVLLARVRPFAEAVRRLPRLVRDLGRATGKQVRLAVEGEATRVDREILARVEEVLMHLVRNAVDHGCEPPEERRRLGKPVPAVVRVEAGLEAHELWIRVADDGRGVDLDGLRQYLVRSGRASAASVAQMEEAVLVEMLLEPGVTLKDRVTPDSGRGVGLDVVRQAVQEMRGRIRIRTQTGQGTCFELRLPLSLSVVRALLVEVALEVYAFPLDQVDRVISLLPEDVEGLPEEPFLRINGQTVALASLEATLGLEAGLPKPGPCWAVIVQGAKCRMGLLVDQCLGERELLLQPLDGRLGRLPGLSGASVLEDGRPVLVVAPAELVELAQNRPADPHGPPQASAAPAVMSRPRVLAVDHSPSVREMMRRVLAHRGYDTDTASNGWEAWQALSRQRYDLVLAGIEMPGLDGVELSRRIRRDERFCHMPVILMSWHGDEAERQRGYEAGANGYLVKDAQIGRNLVTTVQRLLARV